MISVGSMRNPIFQTLLYIYYMPISKYIHPLLLCSVTICATPFLYPPMHIALLSLSLLELYFYQHFLINLHAHCMFVLSPKDHKHHHTRQAKS